MRGTRQTTSLVTGLHTITTHFSSTVSITGLQQVTRALSTTASRCIRTC